jgi:hypothetical protein
MPAHEHKRPSPSRNATKSPTVDNYRDDHLAMYEERSDGADDPRVERVAPVDVLMGMGILEATPRRLALRPGAVPRASHQRQLEPAGREAAEFGLNLVPSSTAYMRWGKGPKQRLRFTKTGDPRLEEAYSRHFVWPGKGPFHPPRTNDAEGSDTDA